MPGSLGSQRLMDWSYAGYMAGEAEIPNLPVVTSVQVGGDGSVQRILHPRTWLGRQKFIA